MRSRSLKSFARIQQTHSSGQMAGFCLLIRFEFCIGQRIDLGAPSVIYTQINSPKQNPACIGFVDNGRERECLKHLFYSVLEGRPTVRGKYLPLKLKRFGLTNFGREQHNQKKLTRPGPIPKNPIQQASGVWPEEKC